MARGSLLGKPLFMAPFVTFADLSFRRCQLGASTQGLLCKMDPVAQVVDPFLELQLGLHLSDLL